MNKVIQFLAPLISLAWGLTIVGIVAAITFSLMFIVLKAPAVLGVVVLLIMAWMIGDLMLPEAWIKRMYPIRYKVRKEFRDRDEDTDWNMS